MLEQDADWRVGNGRIWTTRVVYGEKRATGDIVMGTGAVWKAMRLASFLEASLTHAWS